MVSLQNQSSPPFSLLVVVWSLQIPGIRELMEGIVPYTKRHFSRIDRLSRSTFLLDYTLARMNVLLPENTLGSGAAVQRSSWPSIGKIQTIHSAQELKVRDGMQIDGNENGREHSLLSQENVKIIENGAKGDGEDEAKMTDAREESQREETDGNGEIAALESVVTPRKRKQKRKSAQKVESATKKGGSKSVSKGVEKQSIYPSAAS